MTETNWLLTTEPALTPAEYAAHGGYAALRKALCMTPSELIGEITASGLMGRGGAAFSVGKKWSFVAAASGTEKYVVCNADEGEAGTYKDRELLKNTPFRVLEGMTIAAYAVGAKRGVLFCRGEYRHLLPALENAARQARQTGWLGGSIGGRAGFDFDVEIVCSAGAYICGEETALLNAVEGRRGEPRSRPPFPANKGAFGCPTLINNVETFCNIPLLLTMGAVRFAAAGVRGSSGRKLVSLSGNVKNRSVFELELGSATLDELMNAERFGGGTPDGSAIKACHLGGQSAPLCFPEQFDTPLDYDSLKNAGLSMGSGALVLLDESVCLVDYCRRVMEFFRGESCGKCAPCRVGLARIVELLEALCRFDAAPGTVDKLEQSARLLAEDPACGLGKSAPSALLSALKGRRAEFEAHEHAVCPAGVCDGRQN